ncbi:MAG: hypothetical protein D6731_13520 [Planctomycetota bacterium]|nr:MAG: hypothetical protein D6731_13520 [Planctomycetota bacterium]
MKKLIVLSGFVVALGLASSVSSGCISSTKYGCDVTETLAPGASEGEVIMKHGAPDNIVYLGTPYYNPTTGERGEVDKYLYEYRIGGGNTLLGYLFADDRFHNICYLIEDGRVMGGGYVGEGHGSIIFGNPGIETPFGRLFEFGGFLHPKARAGYGGDGTPLGGADVPENVN